MKCDDYRAVVIAFGDWAKRKTCSHVHDAYAPQQYLSGFNHCMAVRKRAKLSTWSIHVSATANISSSLPNIMWNENVGKNLHGDSPCRFSPHFHST